MDEQGVDGDGFPVEEDGAVFEQLEAPHGAAAALAARSAKETQFDRRAERDLAQALLRCASGLDIASGEADLGLVEDPLAREVVDTLAGMAEKGENTEDRAVLDRLTEEAVPFAVDAMDSRGQASLERLEAEVLKTAVALWKRQMAARKEELESEIQAARDTGDKDTEKELLKERAEMERALSRTRAQVDPETRRKMKKLLSLAPRKPRAGT